MRVLASGLCNFVAESIEPQAHRSVAHTKLKHVRALRAIRAGDFKKRCVFAPLENRISFK